MSESFSDSPHNSRPSERFESVAAHPSDSETRAEWYERAVSYLYGRIDYERAVSDRDTHPFRLGRTVELFQRLGLGQYLHPDVLQPSSDSGRPQSEAFGEPVPPGPIPIIHLAGTKGKGSTASMVSSILVRSGWKVGLYTSPHLTHLEERFRINGAACERQELSELIGLIRPVVDQMDAEGKVVSFFEMTTAMAVLHFDRHRCDVIVLEVGLGGRLDSTNVCASTVAVITSIGLDHQHLLGETIGEIATEKAGIIKRGTVVVSGATQPEAAAPIRAAALRSGSQLWELDQDFRAAEIQPTDRGNRFRFHPQSRLLTACPELVGEDAASWGSGLPIQLTLEGGHQVHNACVALAAVMLASAHLKTGDGQGGSRSINPRHVREGLSQLDCPGRLERFRVVTRSGEVQLVLDTAHNPDSVKALCSAVEARLRQVTRKGTSIGVASGEAPAVSSDPADGDQGPQDSDGSPENASEASDGAFRQPVIVLFGASRDKDVGAMARDLASIATEVLCTQFTTNPRFLDAESAAAAFESLPEGERRQSGGLPRVQIEIDPQQALGRALELAAPGGTVVVCGSFFLAGELRPEIQRRCVVERQAPEGQRSMSAEDAEASPVTESSVEAG